MQGQLGRSIVEETYFPAVVLAVLVELTELIEYLACLMIIEQTLAHLSARTQRIAETVTVRIFSVLCALC
eukprot:11697-Heterococcus_DN1.PRE.2